MTTEYPLTLDEAVGETSYLKKHLPEFEGCDGRRWRLYGVWGYQSKFGKNGSWNDHSLGPSSDLTYRIIPIGHPDHSEYVAPEPVFEVCPICGGELFNCDCEEW